MSASYAYTSDYSLFTVHLPPPLVLTPPSCQSFLIALKLTHRAKLRNSQATSWAKPPLIMFRKGYVENVCNHVFLL